MVNWDRVATLRAEIGAADFAEVVDMFLAETEEVVHLLRAGRAEPTLEAALHFLKGSALNLGFRHLAQLCSSGEKLASSGHSVDLCAITESYDGTLREFKAGLEAA